VRGDPLRFCASSVSAAVAFPARRRRGYDPAALIERTPLGELVHDPVLMEPEAALRVYVQACTALGVLAALAVLRQESRRSPAEAAGLCADRSRPRPNHY